MGGVHRLQPAGPRGAGRLSPRHGLHGVRPPSLAQDDKAKALVDANAALPRREYPILANYTAVAAIPARYALERADWAGAAALPVASTGRAMADSLVRFARGLGMARSGDLAGAKREIQALHELRNALEKSGQGYWADRSEEQIHAVEAWVAYAEGAREDATKLMRAAADGEDGSVKHVAMENRLYPMRELLGELLLQTRAAGGGAGRAGGPGSRRTRTATAAWHPSPARPRPPATGRRPPRTSRSSSRWPAEPTPRVRSWRTRGRFSGGADDRASSPQSLGDFAHSRSFYWTEQGEGCYARRMRWLA